VRRPSSRWLAMAIVLAGLITAVPLSRSNVAAQPLEQIAYLGEGGSVWLTDAESGETVQLAGAQGFEEFVWAPDGQRLALVKGGRTGGESKEIYIVDVDPGDPTKVADGYAPIWSSDGERILYVGSFIAGEEGAEQSLRLLNLTDSADTTVVERRWVSGLWPIEEVRYSSDETLIAVYVPGLELEGHIVIVDTEGRVIWEIPDFVYTTDGFDWSPDDSLLLYRDSGQPFMGGEDPSLKIVRAETQELAHSLSEAGFWPRWSPDGSRIAACLWEEGGGFRVIMGDPVTGEVALPSERVFGDLWNARPSWSPDGSSFLFTSTENDVSAVYVVDVSGALVSIAQGQRPEARWSPDGARIALTVGEDTVREIFVMDADGMDLRKLADGWMPRWRPGATSEQSAVRVCGLPFLGSSVTLLVAFTDVLNLRSSRPGEASA
jgi:Tol biopolymer transport system component